MANNSKTNSMTGFARGSGQDTKISWNWEAKSVNGKGLDVRCRLPQGMEHLEPLVRNKVTGRFSRGNFSLQLAIRENGNESQFRVNRALLDDLVKTAREIQDTTDEIETLRLDGLLAVKGVIETVQDEDDEDAKQARQKLVLDDLDGVLAELAAVRGEEGARIEEFLTSQLDLISGLTSAAEKSAEMQPEKIKDKLKRQIDELMTATPALPEERLAQEAALLMTKADVREELDRLKAHLEAVRQLLDEGGAVGRRLDFLCQEFNREANTLCSKAAELELSNIGLELKAVIEQFREQVQNIE